MYVCTCKAVVDVSAKLIGKNGAEEDADDLSVHPTEDTKHLQHQESDRDPRLNVVIADECQNVLVLVFLHCCPRDLLVRVTLCGEWGEGGGEGGEKMGLL